MDFRRCFSLKAPRPIGDSTILVPQLENYSLFATPFLDLKKKTEISSEGRQDVKSKPEEKATAKRETRQAKKKEEEDSEKLPKETSEPEHNFGIVLNVVTVQPEQLSIALGKGNEIEVKVKQTHVGSEYGSVPFSRKCTYKYELPDDIDKNSLVAVWTSDDFLIILPKTDLREDLLEKSIKVPEDLADKDVTPPVEATGSEDKDKTSTSKSNDTKLKTSSKSNEDGKGQTATKKSTDQDANKLVAEEDFVCHYDLPLYRVTRMLRPGLDILMLRKYMVDLESYVSTARKFIENASFVSHNSKSAERCIRFLAKTCADEFYEEGNFKKGGRRIRKARAPSPDSGYSSTSIPDRFKILKDNPLLKKCLETGIYPPTSSPKAKEGNV